MKTLEQISERWQTEVEPCKDMCKAYYDIAWLIKAIEQQQQQITDAMDALAMRGAEVERLNRMVDAAIPELTKLDCNSCCVGYCDDDKPCSYSWRKYLEEAAGNG